MKMNREVRDGSGCFGMFTGPWCLFGVPGRTGHATTHAHHWPIKLNLIHFLSCHQLRRIRPWSSKFWSSGPLECRGGEANPYLGPSKATASNFANPSLSKETPSEDSHHTMFCTVLLKTSTKSTMFQSLERLRNSDARAARCKANDHRAKQWAEPKTDAELYMFAERNQGTIYI